MIFRYLFTAKSFLLLVLAIGAGVVFLRCLDYRKPAGMLANVVARSVTLTMSERLDVDPGVDLPAGTVAIRGAAAILGVPGAKPGNERLSGTMLRLSGLAIPAGGKLIVALVDADRLALSVRGAAATFSFEAIEPKVGMEAAAAASDATRTPAPRSQAQQITIEGQGGIDGLITIEFPLPRAFALEAFGVSDAAFGERRGGVGASRGFTSSVVGGTVTLVESQRTGTLQPGTSIAIDRFAGDITSLKADKDGIGVWLVGTVRGLRTGTQRLETDWWPNYFDILSHDAFVSAIVSAILGLAGATVATAELFKDLHMKAAAAKQGREQGQGQGRSDSGSA